MDHEEEFGQSLYPDDFSVSRKNAASILHMETMEPWNFQGLIHPTETPSRPLWT